MFTRDIRFEGFSTESWMRFLALWKPHAPASPTPRPKGGVIALYEAGHMRKLLHTQRGRLDVENDSARTLPELAARHEASWAMSAEVGALEELMERFGARAKRSDDLLTQSLSLAAIVRELMVEKRIDTWPARLRGIPVPSENVVKKAIDSICPSGHAMALGLFHRGELWTAITLRRRDDGFDVIAGPENLRAEMGLLSSDWRRDYRHLVRAIEDRYAPLTMGCFAELESFRELQVDPRKGAWSRAVALRDVIVSPMPGAVRVAVGVDGARYAASKIARVAKRVDWFGLIDPMVQNVRERAAAFQREHGGTADGEGEKDLASLLGMSPLEILRNLLKR